MGRAVCRANRREREGMHMGEDHEHVWGEPQVSRLAGTPHRACRVPFCRVITLDLTDDDYDNDDDYDSEGD